jgi:hypothetical protein
VLTVKLCRLVDAMHYGRLTPGLWEWGLWGVWGLGGTGYGGYGFKLVATKYFRRKASYVCRGVQLGRKPLGCKPWHGPVITSRGSVG